MAPRRIKPLAATSRATPRSFNLPKFDPGMNLSVGPAAPRISSGGGGSSAPSPGGYVPTTKRHTPSIWSQLQSVPGSLTRGMADMVEAGLRTAAFPIAAVGTPVFKNDDESVGDYLFNQ